jgi:phosphoserine phosphatase
MRLALFDLDNTLLGGDSDHAWGVYLCDRGILDATAYKARNDGFYQDYVAGRLDMTAYLNFSMEVLGTMDMAQLDKLHQEFMRDCVEPLILPKRLGVDTLLATECEIVDGRYTGRSTDVPCFQEGKVIRLNRWMEENGFNLEDSYFYSDSMNDLPLLEQVTHPIVVDADARLTAEAARRGWKAMTLRD